MGQVEKSVYRGVSKRSIGRAVRMIQMASTKESAPGADRQLPNAPKKQAIRKVSKKRVVSLRFQKTTRATFALVAS